MTGQRPQYPIQSVDNALRLLPLFRDGATIRVTDASRAIGVASSTAHRLLAMLQYHDLIVQDSESRVYRAGPGLLDLAVSLMPRSDIRRIAYPHLESLANETGETVSIALRQGATVFITDSVESPRAVRVGSLVGVSYPAHVTSHGKALLAALSSHEIRTLYPTGRLTGGTGRAVHSRSQLERELQSVRAAGFATSAGESDDDVGAVAVAVHDSAGVPRAALSVSMPLHRFSPARAADIAPRLKFVASEIEGQFV